AVEALRKQGAIVEVYSGSLETEGFQEFVAWVRNRHGAFRGAVHAAGRVGEGARAYVSREFADVWSVAGVKLAGLTALETALADDPLEFLVLYSSVSALERHLQRGQ